VRSWFQRERAEAADALDGTRQRLEADLDRREAELQATPSERMQQLQDEIASGDDAFEGLRDQIEHRMERANATTELAEAEAEADGTTDEPEPTDAEIVPPSEPETP
jgi:chromosome segregation ATPase